MSNNVRSEIGPYVIVPQWVMEAVPDANAFRLYVYLGLKAWGKDGWAIGVPTIAKDMGWSESTLHRAINALRDARAIDVKKTVTPTGAPGWNVFTVRTSDPTQRHEEVVSPVTPRGAMGDTKVVPPVTPISRYKKQIQVTTPPNPPGGGQPRLKGSAVCAHCGEVGVKGVDVARLSVEGKTLYAHPGKCTEAAAKYSGRNTLVRIRTISNAPNNEDWV